MTDPISQNANRIHLLTDGRFEIHAPAKLNLGLRVFGRRSDGYHPLESWFVPISFYDTLYITPDSPFELNVQGLTGDVPADAKANLVGKAAAALFHASHINPKGRITLHKLIPTGGGLGGGSSDAAATLIGLNHAMNLGKSVDYLQSLALELGSDVPFFVPSTSAVCRGRGEIIELLNFRPCLYAVLMIPPMGVSTKLVYEIFDRPDQIHTEWTMDWIELAKEPVEEINAVIRNDLESPAFQAAPWLGNLRDEIAKLAGQRVHMSGSGSTLFTLYSNAIVADKFARHLAEKLPNRLRVLPVRIYRPGEHPGMSENL